VIDHAVHIADKAFFLVKINAHILFFFSSFSFLFFHYNGKNPA